MMCSEIGLVDDEVSDNLETRICARCSRRLQRTGRGCS